ncbi:MAG: helix-turn-helix domain-containing protein [Gemmatimonadota bacterium]|nr:helix-turn-helix domain-containing protein [Gemmatimonadota bacterium]
MRNALERAARADEEVVSVPSWVQLGLLHGYPRLHVRDDAPDPRTLRSQRHVPVLLVSSDLRARWEEDRRRSEVPRPKVEYLAVRLRRRIGETALERTWVDRLLADLGRSAGRVLPLAFRALARHTLEFPCRYTDLSTLAEVSGLSRGALKARFRRRGLASPFTYLRWLRSLAVAEMLSDPTATVAETARALGFTSDTNMCRMVRVVTGATPGTLRDSGARRWLRVQFVNELLTPEALEGWAGLEHVFGRGRVA